MELEDSNLELRNGQVQFTIQFKTELKNYIEENILPSGWHTSSQELVKMLKKRKHVERFMKAFHGAIVKGFEENLDDILTSADIKWDMMYPEIGTESKQSANVIAPNHLVICELKQKQIHDLKSVIQLKRQKVEEIKQRLYARKVLINQKLAELQSIKDEYIKTERLLTKINPVVEEE